MKVIKEVIVVEGKNDRFKLQSFLDVDVIETHGLAVDDRILDEIMSAQRTRGVIILTDPDFPGNKIRQIITDAVPNCKHAFIEKKDGLGKNKVGIEHASKEVILAALEHVIQFDDICETLTWASFLDADIVGDKEKRLFVYHYFKLGYGNAKTLFKRLNRIGVKAPQLMEAVNKYEQSKSK